MELRSTSWRRFVGRNLAAVAVLILGVSATALATRYGWAAAVAADQYRFEESADNVVRAIEVRMDAYISALYGARALFHSSHEIEGREFKRFVEGIEIGDRYRGIRGLGFTRLLKADQVAAHERQMRALGQTDFRVFPAEPKRDLYSAVTFLEPLDPGNRRAIGFDMMSDPVRREAMLRAQTRNLPAASGRVSLVQELDPTQRQPGFLIYLAVYDDSERLVGWVYSPFRTHDLLRGIFPNRPAIDFQVYAGTEEDPDALYFDEGGTDPQARENRRLVTRRSLEVAGQTWTVAVQSRPAFYRSSSRASLWWVPLLGLVASGLLFAIVRLQSRARELSEARERRTAFIAEAGRLLNESLDLDTTLEKLAGLCVHNLCDWCLIYLKDEEGRLQERTLVHRDPALTRMGQAGISLFPRDDEGPSGVGNVVRTGRSELVPEVPTEVMDALKQTPQQREVLERVNLRSYMCVPMQARGTVIGAITFLGSVPGQFRPNELAVAEELARLAASAVDNSRLYSRAQQAVRIRDEFLSVASHELKTPITSLTLKLDLMKRLPTVSADPRWKRSEQVMERQLRRLGRLVDSLLDVSRISAGRLRLDLDELDLAATAREVVASLSDELTASGTALELTLPPHLIGRWDRMRVEQVILNLLGNAIKYGEGKSVSLTLEEAGEDARLTVRDRGIGLAAEDVDRIFQRFERAVPAANYGGLGLGLYISRQIVEALGGTIHAISEGEGSTFTVMLPRSGPAAVVGPRPASVEQDKEKPLHP
ncbi:MAG: CHASE domain-containing protein [Myxococcota bacterium]|nr:CHASE domain-containing protein [Myxococcota bacterium]